MQKLGIGAPNWLAVAGCIFCAIASGEAPARIVWADDKTMAFLDIAPATRGHTLVIPKAHADDLWGISAAELQCMASAMSEVAHLLKQRLPLSGLNLLQANGSSAWQSVPHVHFHLVPRYDRAELNLPWTPTPATAEELDAVYAELDADGVR